MTETHRTGWLMFTNCSTKPLISTASHSFLQFLKMGKFKTTSFVSVPVRQHQELHSKKNTRGNHNCTKRLKVNVNDRNKNQFRWQTAYSDIRRRITAQRLFRLLHCLPFPSDIRVSSESLRIVSISLLFNARLISKYLIRVNWRSGNKHLCSCHWLQKCVRKLYLPEIQTQWVTYLIILIQILPHSM